MSTLSTEGVGNLTPIQERASRRMVRLDGKDTHYSPIDTPAWPPSGSTTVRD